VSFVTDADLTVKALEAYYQRAKAGEHPVMAQPPLEQVVADLDLAAWVRHGGLTGDALAAFLQTYLAATTRLHHPAYMAHQVAVPHYAGALGALIDGFTNNAMAIYEMGAGAASIEFFVVNWLLEKIGWRPATLTPRGAGAAPEGGGVLTHGGSLANLTALAAARNRIAPEAWEEGNPGDLVLLVSPQNHYSISRAAGIMGLGQKQVRFVDVDERGTILPDRLPAAVARVKAEGKRVLALVANSCSTAVGQYDPLREIGQFCRAEGLWLHVDGAHGASALVSARLRTLLDGVELADSLVWDAHKMLRTPTLCAAVLVRDGRTLDQAFQQEASYLFHAKEQPGFDFIHRTVECTKAGLGLRLFMVMAALGEAGLARYVERQYDLAAEGYAYLRQQPDFECAVEPQANILCFRAAGTDQQQLWLRDQLICEGDFHISTTDFNGRRYLRLTFMNPDTTLEDVRRLVAAIRRLCA
jgi:L-2,4-diaminobutyrate decarboxylase